MAETEKTFENLIGTLCEIKTEQNDLLVIARAATIDVMDSNRINFVPSQQEERLPLLAYNTSVKIVSFSSKDGFLLLRGNVYISNIDLLSLVNVHTAQGYERRKYFRLNTSAVADAILQSSNDDEQPFQVKLYDISLGGMRIESDRPLRPNDSLLTNFVLMERKLEFCCRICREIASKHTKTGLHQYGCEFINFSNRQLDQLCNILFKLQRLEIQKRKKDRYK